jgi:hypothetical protein
MNPQVDSHGLGIIDIQRIKMLYDSLYGSGWGTWGISPTILHGIRAASTS